MNVVLFVLFLAGHPRAKPAVRAWSLEPTSYRGVQFGATGKEVRTALPGLECNQIYTVAPFCADEFVIPDTATLHERFSFDSSGRLGQVDATFKTRDYEDLRRVYIEKFGPPTMTRAATIRNLMGASFPQEILTWVGSRITLILMNGNEAVDTGYLSFTTSDFQREIQAQKDADAKKAAKKF